MSPVAAHDDGGVGLLRLRNWAERFRQSLFFLPALFVVGSILLALGMVEADRALGPEDLPNYLSTTVDNARSILSTVAGGTIGSASVVFSLTLVAVQLASSQFSPRVLRGFLGDRFQQVVMGIVVGTFTYSLLVLRVVQQPLEESTSDPFLPRISVLVALVLAVASLLAVLASIDHTAKSLRVGALLDHIAAETVQVIEDRYPRLDADPGPTEIRLDAPGVAPATAKVSGGPTQPAHPHRAPPDALALCATEPGWVTQISIDGILAALPEGSTILLETAVGTYLMPGSRFGRVWPVEPDQSDQVEAELRGAVEIRSSRTMQQDVAFGLLQLSDIALRALSPGVNDPNTANESIVRIGHVLSRLLQHDLTASVLTSHGRSIVRPHELALSDYVDAAIEPIRRYARQEPVVLSALVRTIADVRSVVQIHGGATVDVGSLDHQIEMIGRSIDGLGTDEAKDMVRQAIADAFA